MNNILNLAVSGRMSIRNPGKPGKAFVHVASDGWRALALDPAQLQYLDPSGLSVLVEMVQRARQRNIRLCLPSIPEQARTMMDISGLIHFSPLSENEQTALDMLAAWKAN